MGGPYLARPDHTAYQRPFAVRCAARIARAVHNPCDGPAPIEFSVDRLPSGLRVDPASGIVSDNLKRKGKYTIILRAKNALGVSEKRLRIVAEDRIALTPPMGRSSRQAKPWYIHMRVKGTSVARV